MSGRACRWSRRRRTRIAARHLRALEEERFERLPEPVYARGFLREYAGFLGLDVAATLNGRPLTLPSGTANMIVTASGIHSA